MDIPSNLQKVIDTSTMVLRDVALQNGAIVAANSDKSYYPRQAADYHFVWPRDASYICVAALRIGITDIQEPFFHWLAERPEDFKKESKLFQAYSANGRMAHRQFQPDQMGSVLWALWEYTQVIQQPNFIYSVESLIRRLADGLCADWHSINFFTNTVDLWEEGHRQTSTKMQNNFTYSLAACTKGLRCADAMIPNDLWKRTADQMEHRLLEAYSAEKQMFSRNHGLISDYNMDASLLGLVYPFRILPPTDERIVRTMEVMERTIVEHGGVHRYQFDYYDGEGSAQEGGGAWPLLNFWMSIVWMERGNAEAARSYFTWVLERLDDDALIPEQMFEDFRKGIKPLAWSHAMFVLAADRLGLLRNSV